MPRLDEQRLEIARSVQNALAQENRLTPAQARSFVRCLQKTWEVDIIAWSEQDSSTQLSNATNLLHVAGIFNDIEGEESLNAIRCYKRAAEQLEWLSRADDELKKETPLSLLAGAAYQLGGLPAMAKGLLKQTTFDDSGWKLFSYFIQNDFDNAIKIAMGFWKRYPELTETETSSHLLNEDSDDAFSWYITVELTRTIGLVSYSLRSGEQKRLDKGLEKLKALERMASKTFSDEIPLLITMLSEVAIRFNNASIYKTVDRLAEIDPSKTARLRTLARRQYNNGRGVLWSSQLAGIERLLHQSSFALCTPTGSGKTLVANLALIKELLLVENDLHTVPLAIYLVPSRALAGEVEVKLTQEMGDEFIVTGLYGGNDWGITDYWLEAERPTVLITTVEKADAMMRYLGSHIIPRVKLLIIDEAHQIVPNDPEYSARNFASHSDRALRLESFVSRILAQSPNMARIALTAVAGGAAAPVARWIESREDASPVGLNYRSTRQVIGVLETRVGSAPRLSLDLMNGAPLSVAGRQESPYLNLKTQPMPELPATTRNSLNRYNQLEILWASMQFRLGERRVLISLTQVPEQTMKWYCEAIQHPDWQELVAFEFPENKMLLNHYVEAMETCVDYCGEGSYEVALLRAGIATSHGQMPQRLRLLMTKLIEKGICSITIATATLTEGVNLPFDIIFLPQLRRQSFNPAENRQVVVPLSTAEFRNLSGRAGRPGAARSMEGLTLIALPQSPSTTASSQKATQRRQLETLKSDYISLKETLVADEEAIDEQDAPLALLIKTLFNKALESGLVDNEDEYLDWLDNISPDTISENAAMGHDSIEALLADTLDELDGVLLTAIEEIHGMDDDLEGENTEEFLTLLWRKTFSSYAATQEDWMEQAFINRGAAIVDKIYPDADERRRLYQYGFPPHLGKRFDEIFENIRNLLASTDDYGILSTQERCNVFISVADLISEDRGFGFFVRDAVIAQDVLENWQVVLTWWLNVPDAIGPEADKLREWQRFVSDNLEFRLGVAVGAVVAKAWSDGADSHLSIPSLEEWKTTTGLPWFGFWVRELLRWGTHDPFVAFALAQGIAKTRSGAIDAKSEFKKWVNTEYENMEADDWIDPQIFLEWQKSLPTVERNAVDDTLYQTQLTGTNGRLGQYNVIPVYNDGVLAWLDPAGYELARSSVSEWDDHVNRYKSDYIMKHEKGSTAIYKIF